MRRMRSRPAARLLIEEEPEVVVDALRPPILGQCVEFVPRDREFHFFATEPSGGCCPWLPSMHLPGHLS